MERPRGGAAIAVGALLLVFGMLYVVLVVACGALSTCFVRFPVLFYQTDVMFAGLLVPLLGVMLLVTGGFLRARSRVLSRIA